MSYKIVTTKSFDKALKQLDRSVQKLILNYMVTKLQHFDNPRLYGSGLTGDQSGLWRYRIADYRLICDIKDDKLVIVALKTAYVREFYKRIL